MVCVLPFILIYNRLIFRTETTAISCNHIKLVKASLRAYTCRCCKQSFFAKLAPIYITVE